MAKNQKGNGSSNNQIQTKASAAWLRLLDQDISTESIDHFALGVIKRCEAGNREAGHQRITNADWNSIRGGLSISLRAVDLAMRARRMGLVPTKQKLLR